MDVDRLTALFKVCPICAKNLEIHPISERPSCFHHGDVVVRQDEVVFKVLPNAK